MLNSSKTALSSPFNLNDYELKVLSTKIRKSVFEICLNAGNGHIGGSSGAVELLTTLYFGGILRYDPEESQNHYRDRVLIRGHLGPVRYSIFSEIGFISNEELTKYRTFGSRLQGHEDHTVTPGVDLTPSGSLGMLLSFGVGAAISARYNNESFHTFVFIGDGEEQEGNISEAARHAARLKLNNLIAVLDANGKQLSDPISSTDHADIETVWKGYGWNVILLKDGHDISAIRNAYLESIKRLKEEKPVLIIAKTIKGKGLEGAEGHFSGFHTFSTCSNEVIKQGILSMDAHLNETYRDEKNNENYNNKVSSILNFSAEFKELRLEIKPYSNEGDLGKWQSRYFKEINMLSLQKDYPIFFLTADVTRKDFVDEINLKDFMFYDNVGLREQHVLAMSHGLSLTMRSSRIIINTFDAFIYRSLDQLHAMVHGGGSAVILGDYSGLTNSRNGSTHQSSSQSGAIMAIQKVTFLEPWDSVDLFNCFNWAIGKSRGVVYIRLHLGMVFKHERAVENSNCIGFYRAFDCKIKPDITIVSSGLTVGSCLQAAEQLTLEGIFVRVINIVNHRCLDEKFVSEIVPEKPVLTVYNGSAQFLQSNVSSAIMRYSVQTPSRIKSIGFEVGTTGTLEDLMKHYGLDCQGVVKSVKALL